MFANISPEDRMTLIEHLESLRRALIISLVAIVVAAFACFSYSDEILEFIKVPLSSLGLSLYYIGVAEGFFVKLKLSLLAGLVVSFPVVAWALWRFIAPALYPHERKYVYILFPLTIVLFAGGVVFSYETVLRLALRFLVYVSGGLSPMITVDKYVSFVMAFTLPFGFVFELPVVVYFLTKIGVIGPAVLKKGRKYAILIIFLLAAALTPGPDPISQCLMALPVWGLYEISILVSGVVERGKKKPDYDDPDRPDVQDEAAFEDLQDN